MSSVDQLLACTGLPYTKEVMVIPLPPKFRVLTMVLYDGGRDPLDHLHTFRAHMMLHGYPNEIACRAFPLTLKSTTRVWFGSLALNFVDSFNELA